MPDRQAHQSEVEGFLSAHFHTRDWQFSLPHGWGQESYYASSAGQAYFVKLGAQAARYQVLSALGLTPAVLAAGQLDDGTSILVQPRIEGRNPSRQDYQARLEQFAAAIHCFHHSAELQKLLPQPASDRYRDTAIDSLAHIQQKWQMVRAQVPEAAGYVDESLDELARQAQELREGGLVASHNDLCNANWLLSPGGQLYLLDLESMSLDDPALDVGATLWWYYPLPLWRRFLESLGYAEDEGFRLRMRVRMALHCLDIALPRAHSFDQFTPASFAAWLVDFRAAFEGRENPQGYA